MKHNIVTEKELRQCDIDGTEVCPQSDCHCKRLENGRPCEELFIEKYYGLRPEKVDERMPIKADYGDLVNLLTMFKEDEFKKLQHQLEMNHRTIVLLRHALKTRYASSLSRVPAPVEVDKPDFDDMAAEYFSNTTFVDDDAMNHALYRYSQGAGRIWSDHVLPLHSLIKSKEEEIARLEKELEQESGKCMKYQQALQKINEIRNSIIGLQTINWSEHIYPLVAALNEADVQGMEYPEARENFGTTLQRTVKAEARIKELEEALRKALIYVDEGSCTFQDTNEEGMKIKMEFEDCARTIRKVLIPIP